MPGTDELPPDLGGYRDVRRSFCDRHNRDVHIVAGRDGLRICQVCVAKCAEAVDADTGVPSPPGGWSTRWPLKRAPEK
jgi:hypothetical protein